MKHLTGWLWIILTENVRLLRAAFRYSPDYWRRIHSPGWFKLKDKIIRSQGGMCYDCGMIAALQIHHKHYRNLWHEEFERDVIGLCSRCHPKADHERKKEKAQNGHSLRVGQ